MLYTKVKQTSPNLEILGWISKIQNNLSDDLLNKQWRKRKGLHTNKLFGHCYIATEALYHLTRDIMRLMPCYLYIGPKQSNTDLSWTHWFLEGEDGNIYDPTAGQFFIPPNYASGIRAGFLTKQPSKRCQILLSRIQK